MEIEDELKKAVNTILKINKYCFTVHKQPGTTKEVKRLALEILTIINEGLKKGSKEE